MIGPMKEYRLALTDDLENKIYNKMRVSLLSQIAQMLQEIG